MFRRLSRIRPLRHCATATVLFALLCLGACGPQTPEERVKERLKQELAKAFRGFGDPQTFDSFMALLAPPSRDWNGMTRDQKRRHMEQNVMPVMLALYDRSRQQRESLFASRRQHISKPFQNPLDGSVNSLPSRLDCKTCHGGGARDQFEPDFSKPTTLFPLDPKNMPTERDPDPYIAATVKYMKEIVTPAMALMLDRPDFSCFGCHAKK